MLFRTHPSIGVIGLGYVGLPLAVELSLHFDVVGFDISQTRIQELLVYNDRTHEVPEARLKQCQVHFTDQSEHLKDLSIYIVTVPTPINDLLEPDLDLLHQACKVLGPMLRPGNIVVFESTVYPGVTEDCCGPWLEQASGLVCGKDFFLGYSPERINPGDPHHNLTSMTKVVSGQTPEVTEILQYVYGTLNKNNIFSAKNIRVAEAAKVLENTQRDINIACINEMAMICQAVGISVYDVLEAAKTKWNFLPFHPGLVGGHCIGVDPYYLASCAKQHNVSPQVILAGRTINEEMTQFLIQKIKQIPAKSSIAILGLTFKEEIPDLRNSKALEVVQVLRSEYQLDVFDPCAQEDQVNELIQLPLTQWPIVSKQYDVIVLLVSHAVYARLTRKEIEAMLTKRGKIFDLKGTWRTLGWEPSQYWSL